MYKFPCYSEKFLYNPIITNDPATNLERITLDREIVTILCIII